MKYLKRIIWLVRSLGGLLAAVILFGYTNNPVTAGPLSLPTGPDGSLKLIIARPVMAYNEDCPNSAQAMTVGYMPNLSVQGISGEKQLTLSGTVYAAEHFTVLPDVDIEIWRLNPKGDEIPFSPYLWEQAVTDSAGHYEFDLLKASQFVPIYIHYRVSYQGKCLLLMRLRLIRHDSAYQRNINGPLLHGTVNFILSTGSALPD